MISVSSAPVIYPKFMPSWAVTFDWRAIAAQSQAFGIDTCIIAAVVQKESAGDRFRTKFEPHFAHLLDPARFAKLLGITADSETILQKFSFGPMQVMGGTARGMGFRGHLVELCSDTVGMHYGCLYLHQMLKRFGNTLEAVAAYNAGPGSLADGHVDNIDYVSKVSRFYQELTGEKLT